MALNFTYNKYLTYSQYTENLELLCQKYKDIFKMESLAKTSQNKDIWAITISDDSLSESSKKPAVYIDANIHAGEVTGMMSALYTMDKLCTGYQKDKNISFILKNYTFYILPMISPD